MKLKGIKEDPPRSGSFRIQYRDQHGKKRSEWIEGLEAAQARLKLRKQQVADGTFQPEALGRWKHKPLDEKQAPAFRPIAEVIDEVLAESVATLRDKRSDARFAQEWKRELGSRTLEEVTPEFVKAWRRRKQTEISEKTKKPLSAGTLNRFTAFLSKVFSHAVDNGYTSNHPVRSGRRGKSGFKKLEDPAHEDRILLAEQQRSLAAVMLAADYRIVCLAVETGMRAGNLFGCRRDWIDVERRVIRVPSTSFKGKRYQAVRLSTLAARLLAEILAEHDSEWLFPSDHWKNGTGHLSETAWYRRKWKPALKRAGIPAMKFHACRATCATRMLEAGATIEEVRQQLGHATLTMVLRYARIVEQHHSDVLERMSATTLETLPPEYGGKRQVIWQVMAWPKYAISILTTDCAAQSKSS